MAKDTVNLAWEPPGPVSLAFRNSRAGVKAICGPIGGGKTTTCLHCFFDIATEQLPSSDGIAYAKFGVVRDTLRNLTRTTIPSWHKIVPASVGRWVGGGNGDPALHEFFVQMGNRKIHMRVEFFALNGGSVEDVLRGWEGTALYLNEFDMLPAEALAYGVGRVGRYPANAVRSQIIIDLNAPSPASDAYRIFWKERPEGFDLHIQPGGRSPNAENRKNLPPDYYERAALGQPEWYVRRMIDNLPGFGAAGTIVFPEYNDLIHCGRGILRPFEGLPILLSLDAGGHPALTAWQLSSVGQKRGLGELHAAHMGPNGFADAINTFLINKFGTGWEFRGVCDPSAHYGDYDEEDAAFAQIVSRKTAIRFKPAKSNLLQPRLDAVRQCLKPIDANTAGLLLSECMVDTRSAFNGLYKYEPKRTNQKQEKDEPEKLHPTSDLMDTTHYAALELGDFNEVMARATRGRGARTGTVRARTDFNVFH